MWSHDKFEEIEGGGGGAAQNSQQEASVSNGE